MYRPGLPPLTRTVIRCDKKQAGCRPQVIDTPMMDESKPSVKACECGCGAPVAAGKRFASRACIAIHAQKFRGPSKPRHVIEEPQPPEDLKSNGEAPPARSNGDDSLETVIEVLRYLRSLPRDVRNKALELLDTIENSTEI